MLLNILTKSKKIILKSLQICKFSLCSSTTTKYSRKTITVIKRSLFQWKRKISPEKYKTIDKMPQNYELIYRCTMESYIYSSQFVCFVSLIGATALALFNYRDYQDFQVEPEIVEEYQLVNEQNQTIFFVIGYIVLNVAVCYLVTKIPLRIYLNKQTKSYFGVLCSGLPVKRSMVTFKVGELKSKPEGVLPWTQFTYKIKNGRSIILLDHYFRKPQDMNVMLGYNKMY